MMMRITKIAAALLMTGTAGAGLACTLPPLVAIPAKDAVGDKGPQIQQETAQYFDAMKAYTACVQAELTAAGGDSAQRVVKAVLVQRNNSAVAEGQAVLKAYNESMGTSGAAPGAAAPGGPSPPAAAESGRRRGDR